MRAVLSLGSNMDDRYALLATVFKDFEDELVAASRIYSTPPWGVTDQAEFLNACLIVDVDSTPMELLRRCQGLEDAAERVRTTRWGPRTLDVDIIDLDRGATTSDTDTLTVPHPRAYQRAFVLIPWLDAEPTASLYGQPLRDWLEKLPAEEKAGITPVASFSSVVGEKE